MSTILDALQRGVDHYPGGRAALATRLRKADEVLRKELGGAGPHKLGAVDALAIARFCVESGRDCAYDYAQAVASECGGRFEAGPADQTPTHSPVQKIAFLMRETSDVTQTVLDAMADGVVSDNELAAIEREIAEAETVLRKLRQAARAVNAAGKPDHERASHNLPQRGATTEAA
ncbi:phage regulatory CII family protein [uncultured Pseudacidovorax sp.]|uniref:phage regulatory CII family protein n=1 Tax=uncultured Pseudacidovorax sp. TaxID=679313 RepID=UPI0025ED7F77|nr:phage regulatory CII family protein [uncultured Pseudacidovorax sp.]